MSKIASSKYKHAVPKANRPEYYTDISVNTETSETSQVIKASRKFIAFPFGTTGGGAAAVLNLSEAGGKFSKDLPVAAGHTGPISDLDFSRFDDHLLATGSDDTTVRLWRIPEEGLKSNLTESLFVLKGHDKKIESLAFHTAASQILASAGGSELKVWDLNSGSAKFSVAFPDVVHSISWKSDGSLLTATCKDKKIRTVDPRTGTFAQEVDGHTGVKASISTWLGDLEQLLSTGFNKTREREYFLWDSRNLVKPLKTNQLDSSTGTLLPLYDEDSAMLFLGGKGDATIRWFEVVHDKAPYFQWEGSPAVDKDQQKGLALVPKLALNVNKCEVAQVLRLTANSIIPLRFNVPRKTYSIFHDDLYPDTKWTVPGMSADEYLGGANIPAPRFPVDPSKRPSKAPGSSSSAASGSSSSSSAPSGSPAPTSSPAAAAAGGDSSDRLASKTSSMSLHSSSPSPQPAEPEAAKPEVVAVKDVKYKFTGVRQSSYRYISGKPLHPSTNYDHLKDLSLKMAGECDALAVSSEFLAVPLNKPGGQIGIIPIKNFGRQPPKLPALVNTGEVLDFVFNPFDSRMLAAACDDSYVRVWKIPEGGITEDTTEVFLKLSGHKHRVNLVRFHPTVRNVLVSSSTELDNPTIKYWDLTTGKEILTLSGFQDQVFSFDHNHDGSQLAVVSKDRVLRIFDIRQKKVIREGPSHDGTRGARVVWLGKTGRLATIGFDKGSQREIKVYSSQDLSKAIATQAIDVSPSVLVPFYDEDTGVLFLWGRGDNATHFFEINDEKPFIHFLTKFDCSSLIFGQAFLPKYGLDIKGVEIGKSYILSQTHIESVSFTVPRTRLDYFQDDIYPPTRDLRQPVLEAAEWIAGATKEAPLLSLQPEGMKPVTEAPVEIKAKKYESRKDNEMSKEERDKRVLDNMFLNVREEAGSGPLKQDLMEGAQEDEWE